VFMVVTMEATDEPRVAPPRPAEGSLRLLDEKRAVDEATDPTEASTPGARIDADRADPQALAPAPQGGDDARLDGSTAEGPERCYQTEAMDEDAAMALVETARANAHPARVLRSDGREFAGYWVYIPPHDSLEAAHAAMAKLSDAGVTGFGYVGREDNEHAVSLGVFSSETHARRRQEAVEALGFPAERVERYRTTRSYGVIVGADSRDELPAADWWPADCEDLAS
ncbi:SPOR domain-containing protein, partial [Aquisalimonas sp.]|uniref:SPOR domain-containing protein n=1 Tax=Aquisalimonas sp. TaxID=1872621 RepID=UPI0025C59D7F